MSAGASTAARADGRRFGLQVGGAFLLLAALAWWRGASAVAAALTALGAMLVVGGVAAPGLLAPVFRVWMRIAAAIAVVTQPIFLGVVYFATFLPIGLALRVLGRDPLRREERDGSFWRARPPGSRKSDLRRQF